MRNTLAAALWGLACGCTVAPDKVGADTGVASGAGAGVCAPVDVAAFAWAIEPAMTAQVDSTAEATCTIGQVGRAGDSVIVPLDCDVEDGPRARTLTLSATPDVPTRALTTGAAVTVTVVAVDGQAWLRVVADGKLLVVAVDAETLTPASDAGWWSPFLVMPAATECLADETDCAVRRIGVDVRRSGGAPTIVLDAHWAIVGDRGEASLWVSAAATQGGDCGGPAVWFSAGLVAAR